VLRALFLASLFAVGPSAAFSQTPTPSVLHIKVVLVDADRKTTPVPRHALLISANPTTAAPRQIITSTDGTADVRLRPGNYTVESDVPVAFGGKAYQWTQMVDIVAGRDAVLELTAGNAEVGPITATTPAPGAAPPIEHDPSFLLPQWQDSVVALWTPAAHASGFVIDSKGLIATNQRVIGSATSIEVQITPQIKIAARVLAADSARDVAILWIDPNTVASVRPVPLGCTPAAKAADIAEGQELFTIGTPLRERKGMSSGTVVRVDTNVVAADFRLESGSAGGPVFAADGSVIGITSLLDDKNDTDQRSRANSRVVRAAAACEVVASAEKKMKDGPPPNGTRLPVEPARPYSVDALKEAAQRRAGNLNPYQMSASDFDVAFVTPVLAYGAQDQPGQTASRDFGNWSDYMAEFPPVLLIRVTPKLVEGFWTTVARGAARTQGVDLPPIKRVKAGFSRLRVLCGDAEVTPIHPFKLEQRVLASRSDAIYEGLYVFDPGTLGPHCGVVKLVMYSDKEPEKGDTRVVDPKILKQIWQDFAAYRAAGANPA
jgi:S1-C subfamily serine protease